ncbi:UbiA family prenyltransferase [Phenylobacterium sp.]|uniref:UbiA family prenyltransferase n=1 Tax=Phenylobacterium sp. TaxID=1871053 RepID=UPI00286D8B25|nr:UbiA family prenyltransferase [Phenylobacterium sp.]
MTTHLPDAAPTNWVDRHAPLALRPWLKLGRFDRPTGIWLLMLPGWQGIALAAAMEGRWPDPLLMAAFFLGAALMRAAGCAYNDIVDRDFDAKVARTAARPIPAGQISVSQAWAFVVACAVISLAILLTMGPVAIGLGVASLALVAAYPFMKRITWWPQAWLGLTFNWGALLGYAAATGGASGVLWLYFQILSLTGHYASVGVSSDFFVLGHLSWPAILLYAAGVFWTLGYDTIYAVQDLEDDALAGVKSSALRLGDAAPKAVLGFYVTAFVLALAAAWVGGLGPLFLPPAAMFGVHLSRQAARLDVKDGVAALALFKSNSLAGLLLVIAMTAGMWDGPASAL